MNIISKEEFEQLAYQGKVVKTTYGRPKLIETPANNIIKVFYPRAKFISSDRFKPYALRFNANAKRLKQLGVCTPTIREILYCKTLRTYALSYPKIPGENARILTHSNASTIIPSVSQFIAKLHHKGIFFRSLHLENLLYSNNEWVLLDVVDVHFKKNPLNVYLRYRNLKHMLYIKDDQNFWQQYGIKNFLQHYFAASALSILDKKILKLLN